MSLNEFEDLVIRVASTCEELTRHCQSATPDLVAVVALADTIPHFDEEDAVSASSTLDADHAVSVLLSCLLTQIDDLKKQAEGGETSGVSNVGWLIKSAIAAVQTLAAPHQKALA